METRINKYLAQLGYASRREIDRLIENGEILVNGKQISHGQKVTTQDKITIKGKLFEKKSETKVYFLLNKPKGILSAAKDDRNRKTVVELINVKERLYPIGRLDFDTEGAILLTNDGDIFNKVIHPKGEVYKEYFAILKGEITDKNLSKISKGVQLEDGITLPAKTKILKRTKDRSEVSISIREGKNRQIRRMFESIGHKVIHLKRLSIGKIKLENLETGEYRKLTRSEIEYLNSL